MKTKMIEKDIYLESVRERDTDLLLIEELHVEPAFQRFMVENILPQFEIASFSGAWHSISTHNGESDVIAIFSDKNGKRVSILIENKINAAAQPRQAARYFERGEEGIKSDYWDTFVTCLFAPQDYLNSDKQDYQITLSYEAVQQYFKELKSVRADYKCSVLEAAIQHQRRSKQREVNESSTQFAHKYIRYMQNTYPDLKIKEELQGRAVGHDWFYYYPFSDPSVYLVHQCANGNAGLTIKDKDLTDKKQEIEYVISHLNIQGVNLKIGKEGISLLFQSPKINNIEGVFDDWIDDIEDSIEKLLMIKNIYLDLLKDELMQIR
ncbi:TPA: PD-(D/E)XK nuclease family protein [Vibrio parahaemolyticus]|nr:PD-(D/E)XK nuclease family protein [Vibrio parahaemolyticus]